MGYQGEGGSYNMRHMNPIIDMETAHNMKIPLRAARLPTVVLYTEGKWELLDATHNRFNVGIRGWQSVIKHRCDTSGSPYWMLLERPDTPTVCVYCSLPMPAGIVALFKLQNWDSLT